MDLRLQEIKRKLMESRVIGRVVDDFNPRMELNLFYGEKRISLGDEVQHAEVQRRPARLEHCRDSLDLQLQETFTNPELVALIMTDPDAPGGEYLHWLTMPFLMDHRNQDLPWMELVDYEPPKPGAHMLVFTLFKAHEFHSIFAVSDEPLPIDVPNSRENFSTRAFAHTHALGSPLGASFFNIKYEKDKSDDTESYICTRTRSRTKRKENESASSGKRLKNQRVRGKHLRKNK